MEVRLLFTTSSNYSRVQRLLSKYRCPARLSRSASQVESMVVMAGGGLRHGQVIGSTDRRGSDIATRPVLPGDLAATVYRHLGIDTGTHWIDRQGRPVAIVTDGGQPISELI